MTTDPFINAEIGADYKVGRFVGGYVPLESAEYLRLLAIFENTSTQNLLQRMIESLRSQNDSADSMKEALSDRAYQEWVRRKRADPKLHFNKYRNEVRSRLQKRKLSKDTITDILTRINKKRKLQEW